MLFIETSLFTRQVTALLPDEEYKRLQEVLLLRPEAGDLIPGSGGLRKLRWRIAGKGKRGGVRLIYYRDVPDDSFFMLAVYKKSQKEDLSKQELVILRRLVEEWLQ